MTRRPSSLVAEGPEAPVAEPAPAPLPLEPEAVASEPVEVGAPVEGADVLACPAYLLATMNLATTLGCVAGGLEFVITTSRTVYAQALVSGTVAFSGKELGRMAQAAALGRAYAPQLDAWWARKVGEPGWSLDWAEAVGGMVAPHPHDVAQWTIGEVFKQLGVTLQWVRLEG